MEDGATMESLQLFVNNERLQAFPKLAGGALNELSELHKKVVITVVDESDHDRMNEQNR